MRFKDKDIEAFWEGASLPRRVPPTCRKALFRKLQMLEAARDLADLRTPAFPERHIVAGHHERQEGEQEYEAREKHACDLSASVESASPKRPAPSGGSTRSHRTKQPRRTVSKTYDTKTRIAENPFKPIAPISRAD